MNKYSQIILKNGIRLILIPKESTAVVTILTMFKVGSRDETPEIAGISHLLEHMHYKGTKIRPTALEVADFIESVGGEHNAFTNKEYTGYYAKVTPRHLERAVEFLSDNLLQSTFPEEELEKEKGVIIEEINMYEDLPMVSVESKFEEDIFGDNALGREIIGTKESVMGVSRETLMQYKQKHYGANNLVVVVAGNFGDYKEDIIAKIVEEKFNLENIEKSSVDKIELNNKKVFRYINKKTEQTHLIVGFKTVGFDHPDFFALEILASILGGGMSSRMFEEIREKRGLAYSVKTHCCNYVESGILFTQAGVPNSKVEEAFAAILNEYKNIQFGVTKEELNKAKEMICGKILIKFEDSEELADHYATEATLAKKIMTPEEIINKFRSVTEDDIIKVANKYLIDEKMGSTIIGQNINKEKIEKIYKI